MPIRSSELAGPARTIRRLIHEFGLAVPRTLISHREAILDRQLVQEPIAQAAMELFASICVLSRRDAEIQEGGRSRSNPRPQKAGGAAAWEAAAASLFLTQSARRVRAALRHLQDPDYAAITRTAADLLEASANPYEGIVPAQNVSTR